MIITDALECPVNMEALMTTDRKLRRATVGRKLGHEVQEYLILSGYLYVCFGSILLYKMAILSDKGIGFLPLGVPLVKALILAKFIMLGQMAHLGERLRAKTMAGAVAYKAVLYLLLLIVLSLVEEAVVALIHGRTIVTALSDLWSGMLPEVLARSLIMLLILLPYIAARELNDAIEGHLWKIFIKRPVHA
jgi:hypothetical protein